MLHRHTRVIVQCTSGQRSAVARHSCAPSKSCSRPWSLRWASIARIVDSSVGVAKRFDVFRMFAVAHYWQSCFRFWTLRPSAHRSQRRCQSELLFLFRTTLSWRPDDFLGSLRRCRERPTTPHAAHAASRQQHRVGGAVTARASHRSETSPDGTHTSSEKRPPTRIST